MEAICRRCSDGAVRAKLVTEILALPKAGKSASPENRTCLFSMAAVIQPSDTVSTAVLDTLAPLIGKEGNEPALAALTTALIPHLARLLVSPTPVSAATSSILSRELGSSKVFTRRILSQALGEAVWSAQDVQLSSEGAKLVGVLASAFEANLVAASNNPPANPLGYLEGYVAAALALGPLQRVSAAAKLISSPALQTLLVVTNKPSFLLNERVYTKLPFALDSRWLLRCLKTIVLFNGEKIVSSNFRCVQRQ